jgi:hypothetical protein
VCLESAAAVETAYHNGARALRAGHSTKAYDTSVRNLTTALHAAVDRQSVGFQQVHEFNLAAVAADAAYAAAIEFNGEAPALAAAVHTDAAPDHATAEYLTDNAASLAQAPLTTRDLPVLADSATAGRVTTFAVEVATATGAVSAYDSENLGCALRMALRVLRETARPRTKVRK